MLDMMQEQEQVVRRPKDENISKTQVVAKKIQLPAESFSPLKEKKSSFFKDNRILTNMSKDTSMYSYYKGKDLTSGYDMKNKSENGIKPLPSEKSFIDGVHYEKKIASLNKSIVSME